jgi:hypothetical protein
MIPSFLFIFMRCSGFLFSCSDFFLGPDVDLATLPDRIPPIDPSAYENVPEQDGGDGGVCENALAGLEERRESARRGEKLIVVSFQEERSQELL